MCLTRQKVPTGQPELHRRFVESQPPIGSSAQYRAFSLAANFRQALLVATVTLETTFHKQRVKTINNRRWLTNTRQMLFAASS